MAGCVHWLCDRLMWDGWLCALTVHWLCGDWCEMAGCVHWLCGRLMWDGWLCALTVWWIDVRWLAVCTDCVMDWCEMAGCVHWLCDGLMWDGWLCDTPSSSVKCDNQGQHSKTYTCDRTVTLHPGPASKSGAKASSWVSSMRHVPSTIGFSCTTDFSSTTNFSCTTDFRDKALLVYCQKPGLIGSAPWLAGLMSLYFFWVRRN